ncbi:hypothetical protein BD779DRAFT_1673844 [Infundibulicybe gibba]|nr:hypothetical protein BD779DRAFT_1673844 [Infundibulicybe gibba]
MISTTSLIISALALQAPLVLSAILPLLDGRGVSTQVLNINGHEVHVGLVPIASHLIPKSPPSSGHGASLNKRVVNNACFYGCPVLTCTNGLSTNPDPPLAADCGALAGAILLLAQSEVTTTFPCNLYGSAQCPNFSVPPGFEQQYSLGTCLTGFANLNPAGGPTLSYCDYLVGGAAPGIFNNCVGIAGNTGGFCNSQNTGTLYALEVRHA